VCLQVAVELLQRRTLEIPEIEIVNGKVVDQQFGHLNQLGRNWRRSDDCFVPDEVDYVVCEGQDDHIEAWRSLKMILFIVLFLLGKEGCETQLLIVSWH